MKEVLLHMANASAYIQAFYLMCFVLGLYVVWKFRVIVGIVAMGAVTMFINKDE